MTRLTAYLTLRTACTAVTDWIERLCTSSYKVTEYEGIPELVDAINLQATGQVDSL